MILERSELIVKSGMAGEFVAAMVEKGYGLLRGIPGCMAVRAGGGLENPDRVILLVEWESLQAHEDFKNTPEYIRLAGVIAPFAVTGTAEHFAMG